MATSGTYAFGNTRASELALEIMERCDLRAAQLTTDHWLSVQRSMNLAFVNFSNRGVNLWTVDQQSQNLSAGVATYAIPSSTVDILPDSTFIRTYNMGEATSVTPAFATTISSTLITATQADNGYVAEGFVSIVVPVSVGGIILSGIYQIVSTPDADSYTFNAASAAKATESGGVVPEYTTTAQSTTVTTVLPDHGLLPGQPFIVNVSTQVGGITLLGTYTVVTVPDADTFTFTATQTAGAAETAFENDGDTQVSGSQTGTTAYVDRVIYPISRGEYEQQPNKVSRGFPSTYWFDRLINPQLTLWQVPDGNGPYVLYYSRTRQVQDVTPQGSETVDIPYRFMESFIAESTSLFSIKWASGKAEALLGYAQAKWAEATSADRERVTTYMTPQVGNYYRA